MKNEAIKRTAGAAACAALIIAPAWAYAQVELNVTSDAELGDTINSATDASATLNGTMMQSDPAASSAAAAANINADANLLIDEKGIAITTAAEVRSDEDLEIFERNVAANATSVEAVAIKTDTENDTHVEVKYDHPGKLFGMMPIAVTSTTIVTVHNNGVIEVNVRLPWWSVVVSDVQKAKADIERRIKDNPTVMVNAEAGLSAQSKAEIAEAVITELEASVAAQGKSAID